MIARHGRPALVLAVAAATLASRTFAGVATDVPAPVAQGMSVGTPASSPSPADELSARGWTAIRPTQLSRECEVSTPRLPPAEAVRLLKVEPSKFPRPKTTCGGREVQFTLPLDEHLLTREATDGTPSITWDVHVRTEDAGAGVTMAVTRRATEAGAAAPPDGQQVLTPAQRLEQDSPPPWIPRWRVDPMRSRSTAVVMASPSSPSQRVVPELSLGLTNRLPPKGLAATPDAGLTWLTLALAAKHVRAGTHVLESDDVFGLPTGILLAPAPRRPTAQLELFLVDPRTAEAKDLGSPELAHAGWARDVTDARVVGDGAIEVALVARSVLARQPDVPVAPSVGVVAARDPASGAWRERARWEMPSSVHDDRLRFDPQDDRRVIFVRDGVGIAARPITP